MKLSAFKGEEALDVLADLIDPAAKIMGDKEVEAIYNSGKTKLHLAKYIIKNHKKEVLEILAALERQDPEEYAKNVTIVTLPLKLIELLNDEDLMLLFQSQGQTKNETSSGSVTENIEVKEN